MPDKKQKMFRIASYITLPVAALFLSVSCGRETVSDFVPAALAETAVSDTSSVWHKCIAGYTGSGNDGPIAIFGGVEETAVLSEVLLTADMFDNIDGSSDPDGLPDFAGETVMPVFDAVNSPYAGYFDAGNGDFVREVAMKGFLSSVSGHCSSSAFDQKLSLEKPEAKLFIFSSSLMSVSGNEDVEYVLERTGKDVGILNPVESSVSFFFSTARENSNLGVWADEAVVRSGVYSGVFGKLRAKYADRHNDSYREWAESQEIVCLSPEMKGNAREKVLGYLEAYLDASYTVPLSCVIVDDPGACHAVDSLNAAVAEILASEAPETEACRSVLAEDFVFISPVRTLARDAYGWLRGNDRFTHYVAAPQVCGYATAVSPRVNPENIVGNGVLEDGYKYERPQGSDVETFLFTPVSQSSFADRDLRIIRDLAPVTYKSLIYVY